jgi:prolyl 4-hydroxylase
MTVHDADSTTVVSFSDEEEEEINEADQEHDDDYDGDEEEDEDESSFWDDVQSSLRQHAVACAVAVIATIVAYFYHLQQPQLLFLTQAAGRSRGLLSQSPSLQATWKEQEARRMTTKPHPILHQYHRTSNITFCGRRTQTTFHMLPHHPHARAPTLTVMDFDVPNALIPALMSYYNDPQLYQEINDDDDDATLRTNKVPLGQLANAMSNNESAASGSSAQLREQLEAELVCLQRLRATSPQDYIKGVTWYFPKPTIESMYRNADEPQPNTFTTSTVLSAGTSSKAAPKVQAAVLSFTGFAAKFVNLGVDPVLLYWDGRGGDERNRRLIGELAPYGALATATRPGQSFSVSPVYDHSHALDRWVVTEDDAVQYYQPKSTRALTQAEQVRYDQQLLNQEFAKHYLIHARRTWLAHFPRAFPVHFMWPADYFGQEHIVVAPATSAKEQQREYTLKVASATPRVFTIRNFLSPAECDALIQMANASGMSASTLYAGGGGDGGLEDVANLATMDTNIRSSTNAWLPRDEARLTDDIYRRAAHVTQMDEALLQAPYDEHHEYMDRPAHVHPVAESLQVLRYERGQEYAPHHDWVLPSPSNPYQPTRFATLLLYLNDNFVGGQTTFPRAVNVHYRQGITVQPEKGMAVLFYNVLPDGNVDDWSIHGSEKVTKGVKVRPKCACYAT